jgi:hypothetical protein
MKRCGNGLPNAAELSLVRRRTLLHYIAACGSLLKIHDANRSLVKSLSRELSCSHPCIVETRPLTARPCLFHSGVLHNDNSRDPVEFSDINIVPGGLFSRTATVLPSNYCQSAVSELAVRDHSNYSRADGFHSRPGSGRLVEFGRLHLVQGGYGRKTT